MTSGPCRASGTKKHRFDYPAPESAQIAPDHINHQVDIKRDHAFDLPESFHQPWRTYQPFKGCGAGTQQVRARCEGPSARIEAG
jgi:hypothetical protein